MFSFLSEGPPPLKKWREWGERAITLAGVQACSPSVQRQPQHLHIFSEWISIILFPLHNWLFEYFFDLPIPTTATESSNWWMFGGRMMISRLCVCRQVYTCISIHTHTHTHKHTHVHTNMCAQTQSTHVCMQSWCTSSIDATGQGRRCPSWCSCSVKLTLVYASWWQPSSSGPSHVTWRDLTRVLGQRTSHFWPCSSFSCRPGLQLCFLLFDICRLWLVSWHIRLDCFALKFWSFSVYGGTLHGSST